MKAIKRALREERGSQIAELALALPFLIVLLWGIMDFGQAFNTKQKITEGATQVARFASNSSTLDLSEPEPQSVVAAKDVLVAFLTNAGMNPCGLEKAPATPSDVETWTYTTQGTCPDKLILKIERAATFKSGDVTVIATRVTVAYPLAWHFGRVATILSPGSNFGGPTITIHAQTVMGNLT